MRRSFAILSLAVALLGGFALTTVRADEDAGDAAWMTNYKDALAKAEAEKKVVLADFTGSDWCGWCIRLKKEVFDTPEFKKWAAENVILLELDFPKRTKIADDLKKQNDELAKKYGIRGFPTILFLDAKGEVVGKSGYMRGGPKPWIENAEKLMKKD